MGRTPSRLPSYVKTGEIANWEETADFVIYKDGNNIVEVNGDTGAEYRNTNFSTVFAHTIAQMTAGGHLHIKKGEYEYDTDGTLDDDIIVSGAGYVTVLKCKAATVATAFKATSKTGITIRNLRIDGNQSNQAAAQFQTTTSGAEIENDGIRLDTCNQCVVENLWIHQMPNIGVLFYIGCTECVTQNCHVSYCYWHGIQYWHSIEECIIANNIARDCYNEPIVVELNDSKHCLIIGNLVSDDGNANNPGILCQTCGYVTVVGNTIIDGNLKSSDGDYCCFVGNQIINGQININIGDRCLVSGNHIYNSAAHALYVRGNYNSIISNYIVEAGSNSIFLYESEYCYIANNYILDSVADGIKEGTTGNDNNEIRNNYISGSGDNAIEIQGANTIVRENIGYITENHGAAAGVTDGGTIAHGCINTPTVAFVTNSLPGEIATVSAIDATNITVDIKTHAGAGGTAQYCYWHVMV